MLLHHTEGLAGARADHHENERATSARRAYGRYASSLERDRKMRDLVRMVAGHDAEGAAEAFARELLASASRGSARAGRALSAGFGRAPAGLARRPRRWLCGSAPRTGTTTSSTTPWAYASRDGIGRPWPSRRIRQPVRRHSWRRLANIRRRRRRPGPPTEQPHRRRKSSTPFVGAGRRVHGAGRSGVPGPATRARVARPQKAWPDQWHVARRRSQASEAARLRTRGATEWVRCTTSCSSNPAPRSTSVLAR